MLQLALEDQAAEVDLSGGRLVSYVARDRQVVAAEASSPAKAYRSALLAPWPNRVAQGRWEWRGEHYQLPVNEDPPGTAIHGLVAFAPFELVKQDDSSVRVGYDLAPSPGYPFPLRVEASYALTPVGVACTLEAVATGNRETPVALGVHPYLLTRGAVDDVVLTVPAETLVETDQRWEETGRVPVSGTDLDFHAGRRMGPQEVDACWTGLVHDPDGRVRCRVRLPGGDEVVMWGGATTRYVVAFTSDTLPGALHRVSMAVEPSTAPANALRSGHDLDVLAPGERLVLDWGLSPAWLATA